MGEYIILGAWTLIENMKLTFFFIAIKRLLLKGRNVRQEEEKCRKLLCKCLRGCSCHQSQMSKGQTDLLRSSSLALKDRLLTVSSLRQPTAMLANWWSPGNMSVCSSALSGWKLNNTELESGTVSKEEKDLIPGWAAESVRGTCPNHDLPGDEWNPTRTQPCLMSLHFWKEDQEL